jgi:hypothetical protein
MLAKILIQLYEICIRLRGWATISVGILSFCLWRGLLLKRVFFEPLFLLFTKLRHGS